MIFQFRISGLLNNWSKYFLIVNSMFIWFEKPIKPSLDIIDPSTTNRLLVRNGRGTRSHMLSYVELISHSLLPLRKRRGFFEACRFMKQMFEEKERNVIGELRRNSKFSCMEKASTFIRSGSSSTPEFLVICLNYKKKMKEINSKHGP